MINPPPQRVPDHRVRVALPLQHVAHEDTAAPFAEYAALAGGVPY